MSHVIKSEQADKIGAFRGVSHVLPVRLSAADEERDRLLSSVATLKAQLSERDAQALLQKNYVQDAFERGRTEGYTTGFAEAEAREDERLECVTQGVGRAVADFANSLKSLERLSTLLARDCLDIMLGDAGYRSETVTKIICAHLAELERSSLITLKVSKADFQDAAALQKLAQSTGLDPASLSAAEMAAGDCKVILRLGSHDIGIQQQWGVLSKRLTTLSEPHL